MNLNVFHTNLISSVEDILKTLEDSLTIYISKKEILELLQCVLDSIEDSCNKDKLEKLYNSLPINLIFCYTN